MQTNVKYKVALFASGNGTNAEAIIKHFQGHSMVAVAAVFTNNPEAGVIQRAMRHQVSVVKFNRQDFRNGVVLADLRKLGITHLVLAGFLWLVPENIVSAYPGKIINIHPALLPKFGGKGMFGVNVHLAVLAAREKETGITIHEVNDVFDEGRILFQARCAVDDKDTVESISLKVHSLEHAHFPQVIEQWILFS